MYNYISENKPNRARQPEIDLAKFAAIFLMISCHIGTYFLEEGTTSLIAFTLLGGEFAAPVFMVCMGIGVVFSHHNKPDELIKRGIKLALLGYVLNFIRFTIPEIIIFLIDPSRSFYGIPVSIYIVDILQFAGLAMVLLGFFKKLKIEPAYQFFIALLMTGFGEYLFWKSTGYKWLDAIAVLFWGANEYSYFPLLNWFTYPAAGVCFGEILMHCNDKRKLYKRLIPIGLAGVLLAYYGMYMLGYGYYAGGSYNFMGIKNVVFGLCFPLFSFSFFYFINEKIMVSDARFIVYNVKNITALYCIHWVITLWFFYGFIVYVGYRPTGWILCALFVVIFVLTYVICELWVRYKKKSEIATKNHY